MPISVGGHKAVIVGAGQVGATTAYTLLISGLFSDLVLIDLNRDKALGEAMDIAHGMPLCPPADVRMGDYPDCEGAEIVIITAGLSQKPGETRRDLTEKNIGVFRSIIPQIVRFAPDAILLVVTNPVDILTRETLRLSGFPPERVIGSGTVLDTSRLKYLLGNHTGVDPRNIHAFILGEHGDSEFAAWSVTHIAGMDLTEYCSGCGNCRSRLDRETAAKIEDEVRRAAYTIINLKGATYYAVALAVRRIVEAILRDEHSILTVSSLLTGQYGISDVCLSLPTVVGAKGVVSILPVPLNESELSSLRACAEAVKHPQ